MASGFVLALAIVATAAGFAWSQVRRVQAFPTRVAFAGDTVVTVDVPRGASFATVLGQLTTSGVIASDDALLFRLYVLHKGAARKVTAGEHRFTPPSTAQEILLELMRKPKSPEVRVTIPEGSNLIDVAERLAKAELFDKDTWLEAMRDETMVRELGIEGPTLEGYLFPDTYQLSRRASVRDVLAKMVARHQAVWADLARKNSKGLDKLKATLQFVPRDVVILASIVEKETGAARERPIIAGVFLNRLRFPSFQPKLLETDPTILYGCTVPKTKSAACSQFEGRIRRIHLKDAENPYNTYQHPGLPPGPIANPGREALQAVLAPEPSRYLYFVSRNDGSHQFSASYAEHSHYVELYMRQGKVGKLPP